MFRGKYQIVREIARSNDIVYEAMDTAFGRRIALKELNLAQGLTGQAKVERIERFNREARAAGRLSHPNIVSVFDYGEENGRYFIAMEFLEGQNLRDRMQARGVFTLKEALDIACQVLDALAFAHTNRVIHRDIKPDNIQILPGGQVKLTDFGIARLTEEPALTSDGQVFGTPSYMSPEQIEGRTIDHRSDLFSVGVVLYEMLMGRKPFTGDSVISITYAIMNQEPPSMMGIPTGIEQVVRRALSKSPLQRQTSAEQMKLDLRAAEQTPALFLPPQPSSATNMGQTGGMRYGYHNTGASLGGGYSIPPSSAPSALPPPSSYGNNGALPPGFSPIPPASLPAAPGGAQPWAWNNGNAAGVPVAHSPTGATQVAPGGLPATPGGFPYGFSPDPPSEPLFTLSPGARTFLLSLLAAAILGGALAFGVIGFFSSYSRFQQKASATQINDLMDQGRKAYAEKQFKQAAEKFEQAQAAHPDTKLLADVRYCLAASYIQLGHGERERQQWETARQWYDKALEIAPNTLADLARSSRADALEHLGKTTEARNDRAAITNPQAGTGAPSRLDDIPTTRSSDSSEEPGDRREPREIAREYLEKGKILIQKGNYEEAQEALRKVIEKASGTPESNEARQLLDQIRPRTRMGPGGFEPDSGTDE